MRVLRHGCQALVVSRTSHFAQAKSTIDLKKHKRAQAVILQSSAFMRMWPRRWHAMLMRILKVANQNWHTQAMFNWPLILAHYH
jgi:hypothetical protein